MSWWEEYKKKNNITVGSTTKSSKLAPIGTNVLLKKVKNSEYDNSFFKSSSAFDDGYQAGDVSKTILGTAGDIGSNLVKGIMNIGEGIGDLASYGIAGIADMTGNNDYAQQVRNRASNINLVDVYTKPLTTATDKNSVLGNKSDDIVQSLGYVVGMTALSSVGGGLGTKIGLSGKAGATIASTASTFASSMGNNVGEAYRNGATDDEAWAYGLISGAGEAGSELLFGGLGKFSKAVGLSKGVGAIDDKVIGGLTKNIKNKMAKTLVQSGLKAGGEGVEEIISGFVSALGKKATYMKDEDLKKIIKDEKLGEQFWMGVLTSAISQSPSTISSIKNKTDYITGKSYANEKNVPQESPIMKENKLGQQTILNDSKMAQNGNVGQIESKAVIAPIKDLNYAESAKKYNIDTNNNTVKSIARVSYERGIKAKYDADLFSNSKQNAIWKISKDEQGNTIREVLINPNSDTNKTLQNIIVHELTHDFERTEQYNELKDLILSYDKTKVGFEDARESLEEIYSKVYDKNSTEFKTLVDQEAVADILGSKLGDQEFLNNLTVQNRSLGQKIYDWVVDKLNKLNVKMEYKSEKIFWTDVKNKFENAFKQEFNNDTAQNKFSIQQDLQGNKYVKVDTDQNIFDGIDKKDYNKIAKMYIEDYMLGKTNLSNKDEVIIDKKSSKKYTNPGNVQNKFYEKMKLSPELKNVLEVSEKVSQKAPVKPNSKYAQWEYYKFNFNLDGKNFEGLINIGIDKNGNKHFYEINNIKETSILGTSLDNRTGFSNKYSIAPLKGDVNTTGKYSMQESENNVWQKRLDTAYKNDGVGNALKDVKLAPIGENVKRKLNIANSEIPGRGNLKAPKGKQELLENNSEALTKYISERNSTVKRINNEIKLKQEQLNSKKKQDTMVANKLRTSIIKLNERKKNVEAIYNKKIDDTFNRGEKIIESFDDTTKRNNAIRKNRELAQEKIVNISKWKDKSNGLKYQRETMERNMFDIIPNKQEAEDINNTYFEPIHKSEAEKQRFINMYNDRIRSLELNDYESEATHLLHDQKYDSEFKADDVKGIIERVQKNIEERKINVEKVNVAIETFRKTYDELITLENRALKENGFKEKAYRKGYMPHFIDVEPATKVGKVLEKLGFNIDNRSLPTDIAGITNQFVPGKTWNRSALERKTDKTTYNALKGFDVYIQQASDTIFHTKNIQKLRALENEIRYQYSEKGIQDRIEEIYNDKILNIDEQQAAIDKVFEQVNNPMPNLVTELRRYTNALANKKNEADRSAEAKYGRPFYKTVDALQKRFGANAVGLNLGSAFTNFIAGTQAYSQIRTTSVGRAILDYAKSLTIDDGFVEKSDFLTNRLRKSERLYKTSLEKISDKTSFLFNAIDSITSNTIVRAKYIDNIRDGMNEVQALKNADRFTANVMADRSKGALPTLFEEKNPLTKVFSQFQLEVNNQYSYMFKDIPRDLKDKGMAKIALAFFKMFVAAFAWNKLSEKITGRKSAFSPIDIAVSSYETIMDKDTKTADKMLSIGKDIIEEVPFVGSFLGGGRIPVSGALPDGENTLKALVGGITGEMNINKAVHTVGKELLKPLLYLAPPFAGGQLKKTIEGIKTVAKGGSYGLDIKGEQQLQFPVENKTPLKYLQAGLFGKYALPDSKEYANRGYKSLSAKQTDGYKNVQIPYKEFLDYIDNNREKKKSEKIDYINNMKLNANKKWNMYTYDIFSSTEREDGGSQLSDAQYIVQNGVDKSEFIDIYNKASEHDIDIPTEEEYKKIKNSGIKLANYINYKIKVKESTKQKRASGELAQTQTLKVKDEIQVLLDSKYSDAETKAVYDNYIKSKNDTEYEIMSKTGIDIKQYLKYKQQDFESDKKDDGTTTGKTVTGSGKRKTYEYVNEMDITGEQRLLLLGMQYSLKDNEKTKLANYIKSLKISSDEKLKMYEKIQGFTVYKNGRVTW